MVELAGACRTEIDREASGEDPVGSTSEIHSDLGQEVEEQNIAEIERNKRIRIWRR